MDGSVFTGIGEATMGVNGNEFMDDLASFTGWEAFYRIALAKPNGAILYSNTWSATLPVVAEFQVAPTLVNDKCMLKLNNRKAQAVQIRVVNANGQIVMNLTAQTVAGVQNIPISGFVKLTPGSYHIQIIGGNAMVQRRIMVMH